MKFTLLFPIQLGGGDSKGFKAPVLTKYMPKAYTSPVTGLSYPDTEHESTTISWNEAQLLLDAIESHLEGFVSDYGWVFGEMKGVAKRGQTQAGS